MSWEGLYLICFWVGLFLSVFSLLGGMGHFGGHLHIPHVSQTGHMPSVHVPHGSARGAVNAAGASSGGQSTVTIPWWNSFSVMVFLCWFGASGYLLTRHSGLFAGLVLFLALLCGLIGGAIVFYFLAHVLLPHEHELTAEETEVVGVVGTVSMPVRVGGTGELIYEQLGARRSVPARAEDGGPMAKGEEAFVMRYEKGIAILRRWEDIETLGVGRQGHRDRGPET